MKTHVEIIPHNSEAYRQAVALRYRVLREPLGLTFTPDQLAAEAADTHMGVYGEDCLLGVLLLHRQDAETVKMRQVAVDPEAQGQGLGRILVMFAEDIARQQGYKVIRLNARETAMPFYVRLGYLSIGDPFDEMGLPHLEMRTTL